MKNRKAQYIVLTIIGIVVIFVSVLLFKQSINEQAYYQQTTAIIDEIEYKYDYVDNEDGTVDEVEKHYVYVTYTVDGVTYEHKLYSEYNSYMYEGQEIVITYDSRDPSSIAKPLSNFFYAIAVAAVGVFLTIANVIKLFVKPRNNSSINTKNEDNTIE